MSWFKPRRQFHIRTLSGHVFTVHGTPLVNPEGLMANMTETMSVGGPADLFVGQANIIWIRANQIEALWISE